MASSTGGRSGAADSSSTPAPASGQAAQRADGTGAAGPARAPAGGVDQDCLGCRVTGCVFGVGGAGYLSSMLLQDPPPRGAHRYALIATAGTMFVFGMYRAFG